MKDQLNKFIRLIKMVVVGNKRAAKHRKGMECRLSLMKKIELNASLTRMHDEGEKF